ncbi:hypothetical protein JHK87_018156 [Glycine soja]|nr:hypothetical protein JHK87_018156 [Glycine soja]
MCWRKLGVLSWKLDADNHGNDPEMKKIHEEHGDTYMAIVMLRITMMLGFVSGSRKEE